MSIVNHGQWRCSRGRSRSLRAPIAAALVIIAPAAPVAQDSQDFILPGLESEALLMAELVDAKVTFVDPFGISEASDLQIGAPDQIVANRAPVTVAPGGINGGTKAAVTERPQVPANLTVTAAPHQPIAILVDEVVAGAGYSLSDFRCNYNAGGDTACDGPGYSETSVASGTLLVGATLTAHSTRVASGDVGSFEVTITYQ